MQYKRFVQITFSKRKTFWGKKRQPIRRCLSSDFWRQPIGVQSAAKISCLLLYKLTLDGASDIFVIYTRLTPNYKSQTIKYKGMVNTDQLFSLIKNLSTEYLSHFSTKAKRKDFRFLAFSILSQAYSSPPHITE